MILPFAFEAIELNWDDLPLNMYVCMYVCMYDWGWFFWKVPI